MQDENVWRKCSACKKPLGWGVRYYACSVSTCNNPRTGYVFCSVPCWETHLPGARHKDAAAIEMAAPPRGQAAEPARRIVSGPVANLSGRTAAAPSAPGNISSSREVLIIASRLKDYIQAHSGMNTSGSVMDALSDFVRLACDRATENARADGRKTVLDRDFSFLKKS